MNDRFTEKSIFIKKDKKVQEGNDQEKAQSERNSHSKNRGGINYIGNLVLYLENIL